MPAHLLLIGARASGKSTVGPLVAAALARAFTDLDDRALAASGRASVRELFAEDGEGRWRELEASTLEELLARPAGVVALGGGAPVHPPITARLEAARGAGEAIVVLLDADAAVLGARLAADAGDRPGLLGDDPVAEVAEVLARRRAGYHALADAVVDASGDAASVARSVVDAVGALDRA